jgi:hypothetical protein
MKLPPEALVRLVIEWPRLSDQQRSVIANRLAEIAFSVAKARKTVA